MEKDKGNNAYLSGEKLYGDDFNGDQIKKWFDDEKEGYSGLVADEDYQYEYHQLDNKYGFKKLKGKRFDKVLGLGSAYGDEFLPIVEDIGEIYIIEPSEKLRRKEIGGKKIIYKTPTIKGDINYPDNYFDLITCFSVLHHIPNVSFVFGELSRVLKKGGHMLIREPIVSMGDWTKPRKGLTKHERGIPLKIFHKIIEDNSLEIISENKIVFPLTRRIKSKKLKGYNSKIIVFIDGLLSRLFSWNKKYHSTKLRHKIKPQ